MAIRADGDHDYDDGVEGFDSTPSVNVPDNENKSLMSPITTYIVPPGGQIPDLNLAGVDGFNVASGQSIQAMPDPGKPAPAEYSLAGGASDIEQAGIDSANPAILDLNLAGVDGFPDPGQLGGKYPDRSGGLIDPKYTEPDFASLHQTLTPGDVEGAIAYAGINYAYGSEFAADPMLPDLSDYNNPSGLNIHNITGTGSELWAPDPVIGDLTDPDVPGGIDVCDHPLDPDPQLPDLQDPQLEQEVCMMDRPGDLDAHALDQMSLDPSYQQQQSVPYNQSFMDISGMNNRRRRHMDMLMHGLDSVQ